MTTPFLMRRHFAEPNRQRAAGDEGRGRGHDATNQNYPARIGNENHTESSIEQLNLQSYCLSDSSLRA